MLAWVRDLAAAGVKRAEMAAQWVEWQIEIALHKRKFVGIVRAIRERTTQIKSHREFGKILSSKIYGMCVERYNQNHYAGAIFNY